MPVDPQVQALLDGLAEQGTKSFEQIGVAATRAVVETFTGLQRPAPAVARVIDGTYPGPVGAQPLRIYIPEGEGPLPIVVYFHGGGFVAGGLPVVDEPARALANDVGAIVVAAGYRLAPEHKFPAATDDTFAALRWVADHAGDFGGDPARIAVMGDSAGGSLAAVAAQRARDGGGPRLVAQVLVYPVVDPTARLASRELFGEGYVITAAGLDWFWEQYLGSPARGRDRARGAGQGRLARRPSARVGADDRVRSVARRGGGVRKATRRFRRRDRVHPVRRARARRLLDVRRRAAQRRTPGHGDAVPVQAVHPGTYPVSLPLTRIR